VFYVRIAGPIFAATSELGDIEKKSYREFLVKLIHSLAAFDHIAYQTILLEAIHAMPAEAEEEVYRLRNVRLAERGLLPFDEAVGIYQPLKPQQLVRRHRELSPLTVVETEAPVPLYPARVLPGDSLFDGALSRIDDPAALEQLQGEFASLCNRIIAADLTPVHSKKDLQPVVRKAVRGLSIGLETLAPHTAADTQDPGDSAAGLIRRHALTDIFRVGYRRTLELKWRAQRWLDRSWFAKQGLSLTFWGEHWLGVLGGMLIKKPMFFDNFASGNMYRDFANLDELQQAATVLDNAMACDHFFSLLSIPPGVLSARRVLTFKNLVLTLWAFDRVGDRKKDRFLSRNAFRGLFEELWHGGDRPRRLDPAMKRSFSSWMCSQSGLQEREIAHKLGAVVELLFSEIEEEYAWVDSSDLDPRFIHLFLIEP
jgi:hypothetical protein